MVSFRQWLFCISTYRAGMPNPMQLAIAAFIVFCLTNRMMAGISSTSGDIVIIDAPDSVALRDLEDDFHIQLFAEQQSFLLNTDLYVDVVRPGVVAGLLDLTQANVINEYVNSYFLHVDPLGNGRPPIEYEGSVVFEEEILGIIVTAQSLDQSDPVLGAAATRYIPRDRYRGFEGPGFPARSPRINDALELMPDLRTVSLTLRTTSQLDQVRIITRATTIEIDSSVPEPSSSLLLALGFLSCLSMRGVDNRL